MQLIHQVNIKKQDNMDHGSKIYNDVMRESAVSVQNFYYAKMNYPKLLGPEIIPEINVSYIQVQRNLKNIPENLSILNETNNFLNDIYVNASLNASVNASLITPSKF